MGNRVIKDFLRTVLSVADVHFVGSDMDRGGDVGVLKRFREGEFLAENIEDKVTANEPYEVDFSFAQNEFVRDSKAVGKGSGFGRMVAQKRDRRFAAESAIAMGAVVKSFEILRGGDEVVKVPKTCGSEKGFVEDVLKALDDPVAPGLGNGNEDGLDSEVEQQTEDKAERVWISM